MINDFENMPLDELCEYIEQNHHKYVQVEGPKIKKHIEDLMGKVNSKESDINKIDEIFGVILAQMGMHMKREELLLFPVIIKMIKTQKPVKTLFGSIKNPIDKMQEEHEAEEYRIKKIESILETNKSKIKEDTLYQTTAEMIQVFINDFRQHTYLEDKILFPQSILLESKLNNTII